MFALQERKFMPWIKAAGIAELSPEYPTACSLAGIPIAIYLVESKVCATSNICTHQDALLTDGYQEGGMIECPLHQGQFDIATGRALCAPLTVDLKVYPAEVRDEDVWVQIDDNPS
jgi:nitrite reductase/ring-hydroxylating ferredoxin subunit